MILMILFRLYILPENKKYQEQKNLHKYYDQKYYEKKVIYIYIKKYI